MEMKTTIITLVTLYLSSQVVWGYHCTNVLQIESEGILNQLGNITFTAAEDFSGQWTMVMKTDLPFTFIGGWKVWVQSDADAGMATYRSRNTDLVIPKGERVTMRYRMSWGRDTKKPKVISLIWNDQQLCK